MEVVYKALHKNMTCTLGSGVYHYPVGEWVVEEKADVAKRGLHACLNPLDCLTYYPNIKDSVYYLALAAGDISEDGYGSRISCTKFKLVKELDLPHFLAHAAQYMVEHPYLDSNNNYVKREVGESDGPFVIVRGKNPVIRGKLGSILVLLQESPDGPEIVGCEIYTVDNDIIMENRWYDMDGCVTK